MEVDEMTTSMGRTVVGGDDGAALGGLGDALEFATRRDLRTRRRSRTLKIGLGVAGLFVAASGTALATGMFSPKEVAAGMPAGAAIFGSTVPTCALAADGTTYHCTLSTVPEPEVTDFTGVKELLAIDGRVAGGCIGRDQAGLAWDCYLGMQAVEQDILVEDLLGEPVLGPGRG
jgi:hypothetical protein